jgi:DNA-binding GntR family transcriptional regulator
MEILEFRLVEASHDVATRLRVAERIEVLYIPWLWYVDAVPIGLSYFCLHPSVAFRSVGLHKGLDV